MQTFNKIGHFCLGNVGAFILAGMWVVLQKNCRLLKHADR